jgi:hypothetical protein
MRCPRATGSPSHIFSPSPTSTDRLASTKRSSTVAFLARAIVTARLRTFRSRIRGPTPDKPTVTLSVPDPEKINSFMNIRVAAIQACYKLWKSRGAEFITEPIDKYGEIRCYIRDPDGYIIEVGQSTDLTYG